jgi:hypothetical protein
MQIILTFKQIAKKNQIMVQQMREKLNTPGFGNIIEETKMKQNIYASVYTGELTRIQLSGTNKTRNVTLVFPHSTVLSIL